MSETRPICDKRGQPFAVADYPEATARLILDKLRPVEELVAGLPRRFRFYTTLAVGQGRGFLRALASRDDYEEVVYFSAMMIEPYAILRHPNVRLVSAYFSPVDRFVNDQIGKTVAHLPRQFMGFCDTIREPGMIDFIVHSVTPPDADGFVNLGVNCEIIYETFERFRRTGQARIILEINSHVPWVYGAPEYRSNRFHLSQADAIYENHEPLAELPPIEVTDVERRIARNVQLLIEHGDTLQLGIGGIPNAIGAHLGDRHGLKIHSEMLTDAMVDLAASGAVDNLNKGYMDGITVGAFAAGTSRLYDFIHRNPKVALLPIHAVNDPAIIGRIPCVKSVNSALMVDLSGQVASDALGFRQVSGIGGQLEFVQGAQRSPGGRSMLCIKSTALVRGKRKSNIALTLPSGTPVTIPRQCVDTIVTEWGVAELKHKNAVERAHALIGIAHPDCRETLIKQAEAAGLWRHRPGFTTFRQRVLFNHVHDLVKLKAQLAKKSAPQKAALLWKQARGLVAAPALGQRLRAFYAENRAARVKYDKKP